VGTRGRFDKTPIRFEIKIYSQRGDSLNFEVVPKYPRVFFFILDYGVQE